jgi:hypothetical protein
MSCAIVILETNKRGRGMTVISREVLHALGQCLAGRVINLQDVSDDAGEIVASITEAKLDGDELNIKVENTTHRWWDEEEFRPSDETEFSDSLQSTCKAEVEPDGTIVLIPWGGYDYVYIRP